MPVMYNYTVHVSFAAAQVTLSLMTVAFLLCHQMFLCFFPSKLEPS